MKSWMSPLYPIEPPGIRTSENMPENNEKVYLFCSSRPWGVEKFVNARKNFPGHWYMVCDKNDLEEVCERLSHEIRYAFFPHWSYIVPDHVIENIECVCFHMTDLPYGRGGSPLQNLIIRGHKATKISALRMTRELDAGPIYLKRDLDLSGRAHEIFRRATDIEMEMMKYIIENEPEPVPQEGEQVIFKRRKPTQSILPETGDLERLYDFIRMLDAPGYPHAFLDHGDFRFEFTDAQLTREGLEARTVIRRKTENGGGG